MELWLKNIGASGDRLKKRWFEQLDDDEFRTHVRFSDAYKPSGIHRGDLLLFHAFVKDQLHGRLVGVVRVSGDAATYGPRHKGDQWPWCLTITPMLVVPLAGLGPTLEQIGIPSPPMGSHKRIEPTQFAMAVRLMARVALPDAVGQILPNP